MTQFQTHADPDPHHDVSSNTIFGFWVYLMTDCILFATFFATYVVLIPGTYGGPGPKDIFNLNFVLKETLLLLSSSFACGMAMTVIPNIKKMITWFSIAFLLALLFLAMNFFEFSHLLELGYSWKISGFLSGYFGLIGLHSLHVLAGVLFLPTFCMQLIQRGAEEVVLRRLTCLRMYWHFLYLIWIFTFTIVYLIGVSS